MKHVLVAVALALVTSNAAAQEDPTALFLFKQHFKQGTAYYKEARFREAIAEFELAYRAKPHPVIFYNLAQSYEKLGEAGAALKHYREYLRQDPKATDRVAVERTMSNLERRLGERGLQQLRVYSAPSGATVEVDDKAVGHTPFASELRVGEHRVSVRRSGYLSHAETLTLTTTASVELDLKLQPGEDPPPPPPPEIPEQAKPAVTVAQPPPPPPPPGPRRWTWIAAAATGASLAAAATFGLLAQQNASELTTNKHDLAETQRLHDTSLAQARNANILYGVGGGLGAAAVALFFVEGRF
jgi:tetratricopeptide (TPR) repeat protein